MELTRRDIMDLFHNHYPRTTLTPEAVDYVYYLLERVAQGLPYYPIRERALYRPTWVALNIRAKNILDAAYLESDGFVVDVAEIARALHDPRLAYLASRKGPERNIQ